VTGQRLRELVVRLSIRAALLCCLVILAAAPCACGGADTEPASTTITAAVESSSTSMASTTELPATTEPPTTLPATVAISEAASVYAEDLGGTPHQGQTLYFVVGASVGSEEEAQTLLDEASMSFGDMQSYFIVQNSSNFDGMEPGYWVIVEAYRDEPSAENLDFGRRAFPDLQVVEATVLTGDPIPVYEEVMGL
jgi:hypothetical protein